MKAFLTFFFFIFIITIAMANTQEVKVETNPAKVELNVTIEKSVIQNTEVARLYRFKNSRVKKALKFTTKASRAKMA